MPIFKTKDNLFKDFGEYFDPNWMNSDKVEVPPIIEWDYSRELEIDDVDLWEVISDGYAGYGIYAAWMPYAEFYLVLPGAYLRSQGHEMETYYGQGAQKLIVKKMKQLGIPVPSNKIWVEPEDMWMYQ